MDKQIEEMAKATGGCDYPHRPCDKCWCKDKDECGAYAYAKSLVRKGYRKIPENAVVLTREEYKKWLEFVISYLILFVCEHRRGLGEDPLWQPNEDEREKIPLDLDNMFKKIAEGK